MNTDPLWSRSKEQETITLTVRCRIRNVAVGNYSTPTCSGKFHGQFFVSSICSTRPRNGAIVFFGQTVYSQLRSLQEHFVASSPSPPMPHGPYSLPAPFSLDFFQCYSQSLVSFCLFISNRSINPIEHMLSSLIN